MSPDSWQLLAAFLAAHFVADYWLQPGWIHRNKIRLPVLLAHGAVHAALIAACVGVAGHAWIAPAVVFATHVPIDYAKARWGPRSARWFVGDQLVHLAILAVLAHELPGRFSVSPPWPAELARGLAVLAGWVATISCGRYLIGLAVAGFEPARPDAAPGLPHAGRVIGQLERALVFVLVLAGQAGAIGFLVAAKSVFRFGDLKAADERRESEYVIIGTLMSFGFAVLVAFCTVGLLAKLAP